MPKNLHEIRDPIHVFVRLDSDERKVLNSRCFQRLRHIHQLALAYLVFMYSQVYFHAVRRIYDIHLMDFLKEWIANGRFSIDISEHFKITDNEVSAGILKSAMDDQEPGHVHARRILERDHFKVIYERNSRDVNMNPEAGEAVFGALSGKFGAQNSGTTEFGKEEGNSAFRCVAATGRSYRHLQYRKY